MLPDLQIKFAGPSAQQRVRSRKSSNFSSTPFPISLYPLPHGPWRTNVGSSTLLERFPRERGTRCGCQNSMRQSANCVWGRVVHLNLLSPRSFRPTEELPSDPHAPPRHPKRPPRHPKRLQRISKGPPSDRQGRPSKPHGTPKSSQTTLKDPKTAPKRPQGPSSRLKRTTNQLIRRAKPGGMRGATK